jgi:hypothetical protein
MEMLKCKNNNVWYLREPTIAEILSDSLVKVVMRADGVDAEMLERDLRSMAQTVQSNTWIGDDGFTPRSSPRKRGPRGHKRVYARLQRAMHSMPSKSGSPLPRGRTENVARADQTNR